MLQIIKTPTKKQLRNELKVAHLKGSITQKESLKADQNLDPSALPMRGYFIDSRSKYVRSNYYPDGPGGNYTGF